MTKAPAGCPLSHRQFECVALLANGYSYQQISERAGIAIGTVRTHLNASYRRLGVHRAVDAAAAIRGSGWLTATLQREEIPAPPAREPDEEVTPAQRLYLTAFDRYLRHDIQANRAEMTHMLRAMYYEARRLPPPQCGHRNDHGRHRGIT